MSQVTENASGKLVPLEWSVRIPSYPRYVANRNGEMTRLIQELGGSRFCKAVIKAFREPLSETWSRRFWRSMRREADIPQKQTARVLGVPESTVSSEREPSTGVILTYLFGARKSWDALPGIDWSSTLAIRCYCSAIDVAKKWYDNAENREANGKTLTSTEFEFLLRLFQCDDWFRRRKAEMKLDAKRAKESRLVQEALARRISEDVLARPDVTDAAHKDAAALEDLQTEWGFGWMLTLEVIPYQWELQS